MSFDVIHFDEKEIKSNKRNKVVINKRKKSAECKQKGSIHVRFGGPAGQFDEINHCVTIVMFEKVEFRTKYFLSFLSH